MEMNVLSSSDKRFVIGCNFNEHINNRHPDRIMKEHDLVFIREGEWKIWQEGICYHVKKGDVILLQGGLHHYGTEACRGKVKTIFVHFTRCESDRIGKLSFPDVADNSFCFPVVVHCGENSLAEKYLRQIIFSYWSEETWSKQKSSAYLELFLCEISRIGKEKRQDTDHSLVNDIKMQIKSTPDRFFSVKELAEQYGFSERTVASRFKAAIGKGIHAWQLHLKCQMAEELIALEPDITLKEVARIYGFYDEYHFGKCFKKIYGYTPKQSSVIRIRQEGAQDEL
jgi:AraC-like DNA-binding protein